MPGPEPVPAMRLPIALCVLLVAGLLSAPQARAQQASFRVGAQVVSSRAAAPLLQSLPRPPDSRPMATAAPGTHHVFPGTVAEAAVFYRQAMPAVGFALLSSEQDAGGTALRQLWSDGERRVVVALEGALGAVPATRIGLQAGGEITR